MHNGWSPMRLQEGQSVLIQAQLRRRLMALQIAKFKARRW